MCVSLSSLFPSDNLSEVVACKTWNVEWNRTMEWNRMECRHYCVVPD